MKKILSLGMSMILSVVCLVGCSQNKGQEEFVPDNQPVAVETSHGEMSIPYACEEIVSFEKVEEGKEEKYEFFANVSEDKKVKVYTIVFTEGEVKGGNFIGTVDKCNVYFVPEEDIVDDEMSDEDKDLVYTAQETVNDVIESLQNIKGFSTN